MQNKADTHAAMQLVQIFFRFSLSFEKCIFDSIFLFNKFSFQGVASASKINTHRKEFALTKICAIRNEDMRHERLEHNFRIQACLIRCAK